MIGDILFLASIYVMIAAGYVIVYSSSRVLNFAHGDVFMISAFMGFSVVSALSLPALFTFPVAIAVGIIAGFAIYAILMSPIAGQPVFAAVLVTIGLGIILRAIVIVGFSGQVIFPGRALGIDNSMINVVAGISMTRYSLVAVASSVVVMAALLAFFRYSKLGFEMRAASFDARLAAYRGMPIHLLFAIAWGIALGFGAFAGGLYGMNNQIGVETAFVGLKALVVALVGGMDSLSGAIPAALIVATLEVLLQRYVDPHLSEVVPFIVLLVILFLRPWGLRGTKEIIDRV